MATNKIAELTEDLTAETHKVAVKVTGKEKITVHFKMEDGKKYEVKYEGTGMGSNGKPVGSVQFLRDKRNIGSAVWNGTGFKRDPSSVPARISMLAEHWLYQAQQKGKKKVDIKLGAKEQVDTSRMT